MVGGKVVDGGKRSDSARRSGRRRGDDVSTVEGEERSVTDEEGEYCWSEIAERPRPIGRDIVERLWGGVE